MLVRFTSKVSIFLHFFFFVLLKQQSEQTHKIHQVEKSVHWRGKEAGHEQGALTFINTSLLAMNITGYSELKN